MRRSDGCEQGAVLVRQNFGEALGRGKPHFGVARFRLELAAGDRDGSRLHVVVRSDSDFQRLHGTIPFLRRTVSTADQKSASRVAASWYTYGRTVPSTQPVFVIECGAWFSARAQPVPHRMRIVESHQTFTIRTM